MDLDFFQLTKHYSFFLINVFVYIFIGHLFFSFGAKRSNNEWKEIFVKLVIGFLLLSSSFAIITTGGKSVTLLIVALLFLLFYFSNGPIQNIKLQIKPIIGKRNFLILFLLSIVIYLLQTQWFIDYTSGDRFTLANDMLFWARLSEHVFFNGAENVSFAYFEPKTTHAIPYHWLEIWNSAFNIAVFSQPSSYALILNTFSSLSLILVIGAIAISKQFKLNTTLAAVISPLILFCAHYYLQYHNTTPSFTALNSPKMLPVMVLFLAAILKYKDKELKFAAIFIALAGISYIVVLPSMYTAATLAIIFLFFNKKIEIKECLGLLSILILSVFAIILFYYFAGSRSIDGYNNIGTIGNIKTYIALEGFGGIIKKITITSFKFIGNWIFFGILISTLLISKIFNRQRIIDFSIISLFLIIPASFWAIMQWHHESYQLQTVQFHSIMPILNFMIIAYLFSLRNRKLHFLAIVLSIYVLWVQPERTLYAMQKKIIKNEFNTVDEFIKKSPPPYSFAQIKKGNDNTSEFFQANTNLTLYDIEFISQIVGSPFIVPTITVNDIVLPNDPFLQKAFKQKIQGSTFNSYLQINEIDDNQMAREKFVLENNISFIVFGDDSFLNLYQHLITDTIRLASGKIIAKTKILSNGAMPNKSIKIDLSK